MLRQQAPNRRIEAVLRRHLVRRCRLEVSLGRTRIQVQHRPLARPGPRPSGHGGSGVAAGSSVDCSSPGTPSSRAGGKGGMSKVSSHSSLQLESLGGMSKVSSHALHQLPLPPLLPSASSASQPRRGGVAGSSHPSKVPRRVPSYPEGSSRAAPSRVGGAVLSCSKLGLCPKMLRRERTFWDTRTVSMFLATEFRTHHNVALRHCGLTELAVGPTYHVQLQVLRDPHRAPSQGPWAEGGFR